MSLLSRVIKPRAAARLAPRAVSRAFSAQPADEPLEGMFSLQLSDEQEALKQLARDFAKNEMIPVAAEYDRTMEYPVPVFEKAWECVSRRSKASGLCDVTMLFSLLSLTPGALLPSFLPLCVCAGWD